VSWLPPPPERVRRLWLPEASGFPGGNVREAERALERTPPPPAPLDLTCADTHRFPPPEWVLEDFAAAAGGAGATYTPYRGDAGVRLDVAANLSRFLGVAVDPDTELMLAPGTQAGLFAALSVLVDHDTRVLVADPDYMTNLRTVRYLGATPVPVPLRWPAPDATPVLDLEALERATRGGPYVLLLSHPNNPTGAVHAPEVIGEIARLAVERDGFVVIDELYARLVYDGLELRHLIAIEGMKERCLTLAGPSKTESMSGYRVGAAVGPPEVVDRMEDVLSVSALRCPAYAQHTLRRWLRDDAEFVERRVARYQEIRDRTVDFLGKLDGVSVAPALGTAYLFPDVGALGLPDQEVAMRLKEKAGLIVNPGYQFGASGAGHFRLCFAQDEVAWERALDRMAEVIGGSGPRQAKTARSPRWAKVHSSGGDGAAGVGPPNRVEPMALDGVEVDLGAVGVVEDHQPADGRVDHRRVLDAELVQPYDPGLGGGAVGDREADRVEAGDAAGGVGVLAQGHPEARHAGEVIGDATHHAVVIVAELEHRPQSEDPLVPAAAASEVGDRELDVVDADQDRLTHAAPPQVAYSTTASNAAILHRMTGPVKRGYRSPLREESARNTRARIRDAAAALFVEQGFVVTTMKQVAAAAGVADRTVYAAFPTKLDLYHEVLGVATVGDELPVPVAERPEFRAAIAETDGRRALALAVDYGSALLDRAGALIMAGIESAGADADMRRIADEGARATAANLGGLAQALADHGALRPDLDVEHATDVLLALSSPQVHDLLRHQRGWSAERYRAWLLETLAKALLSDPGDAAARPSGSGD
jgi:aspartate/methionine/tyrosine aminotransferase/AcrR family transcriptional regulator